MSKEQGVSFHAWEQAVKDYGLSGNPNQACVVVPLIDICLGGIEIPEGTPLPISSWAAVQDDGSFHPRVGVCWPGLPEEIHLDLKGTPYVGVLQFCALVKA